MNALILVDLQNDFVPGGALPVAEGDTIIPLINRLQESGRFDMILATQDWHPANHASFAANHPGRRVGEVIDLNGLPQVLWPIHCVQETPGASFVDGLSMGRIEKVFQKGTDPAIDSYSGFFDNGHRRATGMGDYVRSRNVTDVYLCGLATDYCVKFTALDARQLGFNTFLIEDASRGVNLKAGDVGRAVEEMRHAGVSVIQSMNIIRA